MPTLTKNNQDLKTLSQVFSPAMFHKIVREDNFESFKNKTINCLPNDTNRKVITTLYKRLQREYRCEYIYKNNLLIDSIKKYGLQKTLALNELRVGSSKADLVLLNDVITIYEIKTELDNFTNLSKQLTDYQKFADKVYVVTDIKNEAKLTSMYKESNVGIITFDKKNNLQEQKEAKDNFSRFEFDTIFKVLRKQEYMDLATKNYGDVPPTPNTKIFRVCYEMLSRIDLIDFQKQVLRKLKERNVSRPQVLKSDDIPDELKYICHSLDFNRYECEKLYHFLKSKN